MAKATEQVQPVRGSSEAASTAPGERPWTAAQRAAIEHLGGDLLVSAAAGSGKTAVLAARCARLVTREGPGRTTVDRLLVLTFTEAAANEMRTRIGAALREKLGAAGEPPGLGGPGSLSRQLAMVERAHISTLHAFCARVLRSHFHEALLDPAFEVFDEEEARLLRDDVMEKTLARWHQESGDGIDAQRVAAFGEFYEAFAQGDDRRLAGFIHGVHAMMESVPDPAAWVAAARETYTAPGAAATCARYVAGVARELLMQVPGLARQITVLGRVEGGEPLVRVMREYRDLLKEAGRELSAHGPAAWDAVAARMRNFSWGTLRAPRGAEDFAALRDRIVNPVRDDWKKLRRGTFAEFNSSGQLLADMEALVGSLEILLELTADFQREYAAAKRRQNRLDFADLERFTLQLLRQGGGEGRGGKEGGRAAAELRGRFDHILVDEFQDINPLQAALLAAVRDGAKHEGRGNLFVVGDVKQAIYGFRLADPEQFLARERTARTVTTHTAFIPLQHNFRSRPALLGHLNAIFGRLLTAEVAGVNYAAGHELRAPEAAPAGAAIVGTTERSNEEADPKPQPFTESVECHVLVTDARKPAEPDADEAAGADEAGEGGESSSAKRDGSRASDSADIADAEHDEPFEPEAAPPAAMEQEARMVARRIADMMRERRGIREESGLRALRYRDIAILLRGARGRALLFTRALAEQGIPVHADLSTGFFDAEEIAHTLALLHLLDNPRQDIPLATVMLSPYFRCGVEHDARGETAPSFTHDDLALLRLAFPHKSEVPFHEAVIRVATDADGLDTGRVSEALRAKIKSLFGMLERYRRWVRMAPLHEALADIFRDQHVLTYVAGLADGRQRAANLQALQQRALQFASFRQQGLHRFLRFIERLRESEGDFGEAPVLSEASDVVRIMTIHKSKGLEFPVVFVSALGVKFNLDRPGPVLIDRDEHVGLEFADVPRNLFRPTAVSQLIAAGRRRRSRAEELRLLYVAMTRARDHLILTGATKQATYDRLVESARGQVGALGEETLLRANTFLDYLVPVAAAPALQPHIRMILHTPEPAAPPAPAAETAMRLAHLQQHEPLADTAALAVPAPRSAVVDDLLSRLDGRYAYEPLPRIAAKLSVSELKRAMFAGEELPDAELAPAATVSPVVPLTLPGPQSASSALARGIATHRLLELLDFSMVHDAPTLDAFLAEQLRASRLLDEQVSLIDRAQILWFLSTDLAARLRSGSATIAAIHAGNAAPASTGKTPKAKSKHSTEALPLFAAAPVVAPVLSSPALAPPPAPAAAQIYREVPFIYPLSPADVSRAPELRSLNTHDPADAPLLRGVIDLLLITPQAAEIVDYKTDAPRFLADHLPAYRLQMHYYARAAAAILRRPVPRATLVLLAAQEILTIENPAGAP